MQRPLRFRIALLVLGFFLQTSVFPATADDGDKPQPAIVLKNATIHSMGSKGTFVGSIVVVDGMIQSIGESIKAPKGATVYDLGGFHATPGLIESRGKLWLTANALTERNSKAELKVVDAVDPWNEDWKELAAQGITSVYAQPNSTNTVGGMGAVLRVGPHGTVENIVMKDDVAVQVSIGTSGRSSKDRFAQIQSLEKLLKSAQDKKKEDAKDKDNKEASKDKKESEKKEKKADDSKDEKKEDKDKEDEKKDVTKEIFKRVLKREIPLFIEVHHSDALKRVIALAKEFKIRVVLDGLTKVENCKDLLVESDRAMVVGPFFETASPPEYRKNANMGWFSELETDEKLWSLSTFASKATGSQALRINAAQAVGHGLDSGDVLKALTANAARMLGIADHVGTLEAGKQADIAVFAGSPTDSSTPVRLVLSHGKVIFESDVEASKAVKTTGSVALPKRLPKNYAVSTSRLLRDGKLASGTLVVVDGKISFVADQADAKAVIKTLGGNYQEEIQSFDLGDAVVTPGLVIAHSSLDQASTINDPTESDASHLRAVDAFDPTTKKAKEALKAGFIHIGLAPGTSNTSSGALGQVRLGVTDYVQSPAIANQFVLSGLARNVERFPASLNGQVRMISDLFRGRLIESRVYFSDAVAKSIADEKRASVNEVATGKRNSIFLAADEVEIRSVITLAKDNKLAKPVLASGGSVGDLASELVEGDVALLVPPIVATDINRRTLQTKKAVEAGIPIGFAGNTAKEVRTTATLLAAAGVPTDNILRGLTSGGGSLVGMKDVDLKAGANADFVVWSDSPVNLAAKPLNVIVAGKPVSGINE